MTGLKAAREALGWTQDRAVAELRRLASARGRTLTNHLKTQLSRWENGHVVPDREYRELLSEAYGRTEEELGFPLLASSAAEVEAQMLAQFTAARATSSATAEAYLSRLNAIRALDGSMGTPSALGQLRPLMTSITQTLTHVISPRARSPLASVLADACSLAGWQAIDSVDLSEAWRCFETAKAAARESEDPAALAYATAEQAYVLLELQMPAEAVELAQHARESSVGRVPSILSSWLNAVEAEALAATTDKDRAQRVLDRIDLPDVEDYLPYILLDQAHLDRWRGNILAALGDPNAAESLLTARRAVDPTYIRARASMECDLARALLAQGERREASRHAAQARTLARQSGSVRQLRRVDALAAGWRRERPQ